MQTQRLTKLAFLLAAFFLPAFVFSQTVSQFDFNTTATIGTATIGPNATWYNPNSAVVGGVVHITVGCGHGFGLDMAVPGANFDTDNIQIITRFRRTGNEGTGNFFLRGSTFFGFRGRRLIAEYVYDDAGTPVTVSMPTDHWVSNSQYENYTFSYDNCTGIAQIWAGSLLVGYFDGPDNRDLYWAGFGDGLIAENVDNGCTAQYGMDWIMINGNSGSCLPLPVEFEAFTGHLENGKTQLKWSTASESNNDHFTVERSLDGLTFEPITTVPSSGNSSEIQNYAAEDPAPPAANLFYRIIQTDFNGGTSASEIITLDNSPVEDQLSLFPNPTTDRVTLNFSASDETERSVALLNLNGQTIFTHTLESGQTHFQESYDLSGYPKGIYLFRVASNQAACTKKLILH